jgi:predicted membrane metal-binding protein
MWMLAFVPDSFLLYLVNMVFYTGIVCTVLGFLLRFKFLAHYQFILQVVGVLALALGLYFKGGFEVEHQWRDRVAAMEAKVAAAEAKSKEVNTVIQKQVVTKIQKVKEVEYKNREVIKQVEKIIDRDCTVPPEAIDILNAAARNEAVILKGLPE